MDDEIEFNQAMGQGVETISQEAETVVDEAVVSDSSPTRQSDQTTVDAEATQVEEKVEVSATPDLRFTAEEETRISAALEALKSTGQDVDPEAFRAEVVRQKEALEAEKAEAVSDEIAQSQRTYAQGLHARTQLDPGDPKFLTEAAAEELWQEKLRTARLEREISDRDAKLAGADKEKAIERVRAEFPDADEEVLRLMADSGKSGAELQAWAKRDSDRLAKRDELARAKYAATKSGHEKTTTTTGAGVGSNAAAKGEMTFEESMR